MTSKIFIYSWELISRHPKIHIRAHFIEENPPQQLELLEFERIGRLDITDFKVFCHINKFQLNQAIEASGIKPEHVKSYEARLSTNISKKEKYLTVYFSSAVNMEQFCKFCRPRPLMSEINPLTLYLATNEYPRTGWFERQTHKTLNKVEGSHKPLNLSAQPSNLSAQLRVPSTNPVNDEPLTQHSRLGLRGSAQLRVGLEVLFAIKTLIVYFLSEQKSGLSILSNASLNTMTIPVSECHSI
jgi:hypothetical protein